jgi:hypothetical protein
MTAEKAFAAYCRREGIKYGGQTSDEHAPAFIAGYNAGQRAAGMSSTPETPTRRNKTERLAMQYGHGRPMTAPRQELTAEEAQATVAAYRAAYPPMVFDMDYAAIEARTVASLRPGYCGDPYVHDCGRLDCPTSDSYRSPKP